MIPWMRASPPDISRQPEGAGSGSCEVAAGTGHRGDAGGQRGARPGHGPAGAAVAAWPAVALVGSYELLMMIIRGAQVPADVTAVAGLPGRPPDADPLQMQVAQVIADDLAAGRVASVRAIETRGQLCSGLLSLQRARRSNRGSPGVPPHGRAQRPGRRLNRGVFPATGRGSPTPLVNAALHT